MCKFALILYLLEIHTKLMVTLGLGQNLSAHSGQDETAAGNKWTEFQICQFSHSVLSNSLWPHGLQQTRLPCPSPTPRACPNSCPLTWWRHPTISSSVVPFSSCFQSFPASGSFPMNQFFSSGGQSIRVSASASDLPMCVQDWSPLGWTGLVSLQSKGLLRVFSSATVQKHQYFSAQLSLWSNSHIHTWLQDISTTLQDAISSLSFYS